MVDFVQYSVCHISCYDHTHDVISVLSGMACMNTNLLALVPFVYINWDSILIAGIYKFIIQVLSFNF